MNQQLLLLWLLMGDEDDNSPKITLVRSTWRNARWNAPDGLVHYVITGVSLEEKKRFDKGVAAFNRGDIYFVYQHRLEAFQEYAAKNGYSVKIKDYDNEEWK